MTLRDYIINLRLDGTPEEITEALNAKSIPDYNAAPLKGTDIADELGPELARQVLFGIEAAMQQDPLLRAWYNELTSIGIDFSSPMTQQLIDHMQKTGFLSKDLASQLKQIGIRYISPYEQFAGDGAVVTVDQVKAALQSTDEREIRLIIQGDICERSQSLEITMTTTKSGDEDSSSCHRFLFTGNESSGDADIDELARDILSSARECIRLKRGDDPSEYFPDELQDG